MRIFIPLLLLLLPTTIHASSLDPIERLLVSTPRRHVRRGGLQQKDHNTKVTADMIRWPRRQRQSLQRTQTLSGVKRRLDADDSSRDEEKEQGGQTGDGSHRTWGQASGNTQGGYHANGYHNGYTQGGFNESMQVSAANSGGGPTGDHSYIGCLGLSNYELEHEWKFSGSPPSCSYVHHSHKKKRTSGEQATSTCHKKRWYSSCHSRNNNSSTRNHTWSYYFTNHFSSSGRSANTTNATAAYEAQDAGADEKVEEGEGEERDEEGDERQDGESDSQDEQPDDDTVLTNENYENVNGDDFTYKESSSGAKTSGKKHWWKNWSHKSNSTGQNATDGEYAAAQAEAAENDNAVEEEEDEENNSQDEEENKFDPYNDFDLEQCDSYENLWLWDLSLTCKNAKSLDSCECSYAEGLLYEGTIFCDDFSRCPDDCAVCRTCFQLMGCVKSYHDTSSLNPGGFAGLLVGAMAFILVGGIGYYIMRRRGRTSGDLGLHLMWRELGSKGESESDTDSNDSGAWPAPAVRSLAAQQSYDAPLFDDYYRSMDEGDTDQQAARPAATSRLPVQLNGQGEAVTFRNGAAQDAGTVDASVVDGDSSSATDNSDESSQVSEFDSSLDGSTVLSADETGGQKIWLAPVDVKLDQED